MHKIKCNARRIDLQVFVNYPKEEEKIKYFLDNLATFKLKLLLKSIENLNASDKTKEEVLKKVIEILNSKSKGDVI